jgi:hypothetical protein
MPPNSRQVDVQHEHGERNKTAPLRFAINVFLRAEGRWPFGELTLIVHWTETRPMLNEGLADKARFPKPPPRIAQILVSTW